MLRNLQLEFQRKHPFEALYESLAVRLTKLEASSPLFQIINKAACNTQAGAHSSQVDIVVRDIYEIDKPSEKLRFMPFERKLHNKCLLWQGFRKQAAAAVLRNGIRLPHPDSAQAGYMFGKGIYLTDCFSKALLASSAVRPESGTASLVYVVLAEVALGDMHKAFQPHQFKRSAPNYCHSVYGVGQ